MTLWLDKVRLVVTTKDVTDAGTDDVVFIEYFLDAQLKREKLDHKWNDRERGRTEMYEVNIEKPPLGTANDPAGFPIGTWNDVRQTRFRLQIIGDDAWLIDNYFLLGHFYDSSTFPAQDLGWQLMAYQDADVKMSTDDDEGPEIHDIEINGPLPLDPNVAPVIGSLAPPE